MSSRVFRNHMHSRQNLCEFVGIRTSEAHSQEFVGIRRNDNAFETLTSVIDIRIIHRIR